MKQDGNSMIARIPPELIPALQRFHELAKGLMTEQGVSPQLDLYQAFCMALQAGLLAMSQTFQGKALVRIVGCCPVEALGHMIQALNSRPTEIQQALPFTRVLCGETTFSLFQEKVAPTILGADGQSLTSADLDIQGRPLDKVPGYPEGNLLFLSEMFPMPRVQAPSSEEQAEAQKDLD